MVFLVLDHYNEHNFLPRENYFIRDLPILHIFSKFENIQFILNDQTIFTFE
jgi:hypothetical protein